MNILEQYWQKGGTYVIPVEIINQINGEFEEKDKEIERLNSIIKEAREYINSNEFIGRIRLSSDNKQAINKLLEILDKVEENSK